MSLDEALKEADRILSLWICNQQQVAQKECDDNIHKHFYFHVLSCFFKGLNAVITFEDDFFAETLEETSTTLAILEPLRKKRSFKSRYLSWSTPDYNKEYTDEQIHAEGAHCIVSALAALLTLLSEKSITGLVRSGLHCKNAFYTLRDVKAISSHRTKFQSKASEDAVKAGVELGFGLFNLIFSMLPARVLRILKWVGWPSDRAKAFRQLKYVSNSKTMWSPIAALSLLGFNCFIEFYVGLGHPDITLIDNLLDEYSIRYPNSAFFWLFEGTSNQLKGKTDEAIIMYQKSADSFTQWIEWKNLCYWLMAWCHCVKFNWRKALELTDQLIDSCPWSPCVFTYQSAAIMKMLLDETVDPLERESLQSQITEKLKLAPKLKRPIAGRTIYIEKFVTKRCEIYWQELKEEQKVATISYNTQDSGIYDDDGSSDETDESSEANDSLVSVESIETGAFNSLSLSESNTTEDCNSDEETYNKVNKLYQSNDPLLLPILDLFLIWNIYLTFKYDHESAHLLLKRIESKLLNLRYEDTREKYLYLILMRGIVYKSIGNHQLAVDCFSFVLENEKFLQYYKHLAPHAALEFGLLSQQIGDLDMAVKYINKSINDYSHYLNETQIHIRAHTALNIIRENSGAERRSSVTSITSNGQLIEN